VLASCGSLALLGVTTSFWVAVALLVAWALLSAATVPIRQAYLNGLIPSEQRATVLSFDNLLGSGGGVVIQPALGRAADAWSYPTSLLAGAAVQVLAPGGPDRGPGPRGRGAGPTARHGAGGLRRIMSLDGPHPAGASASDRRLPSGSRTTTWRTPLS
jgi:MFS family permease